MAAIISGCHMEATQAAEEVRIKDAIIACLILSKRKILLLDCFNIFLVPF
jgi:hypothetical protein